MTTFFEKQAAEDARRRDHEVRLSAWRIANRRRLGLPPIAEQEAAAVPYEALPPAAPVTESTAPATVTPPKVVASPLADLARLVAAQPPPPPRSVRKPEVDGADFILNAMRLCGAKV